MADEDQQPQQRYWFPYWSGQPPCRPLVRPQMSRRPSAAPVAPSPPRGAPSQHRQPSRGGVAPPPSPPPAQPPQVPRQSPSRASPLAPIREPPPPPTSNSNAGATAPPKAPSRPVAAREAAPKLKDVDVVVPQEKSVVQQPAVEIKPHGKATDDKEHKTPKDKEETKTKEKVKEKKKEETKSKEKEKEEEKEKDKDEIKSKEKKEKEKEKEKGKEKEKEKGKEKEKKHHVGDDASKHKEIMEDSSGQKRSHGEQGKLHTEIKAGVADMVHKASGGSGHEHAAGSSTVITLAGENKGASMKVGGAGPPGKEGLHGHGRRLDGNDDREAVAGEGRGGKQGTMRALVNSNVQVINNSLMLQSSCSGGDPGVHLKLSAKSKSKDKQRQAGNTPASTTGAKK